MQEPPSQQPSPHWQPAPSEIYVPEQSQVSMPQPPVYSPPHQFPRPVQVSIQPPMPVQDIAIYPNRGQAIWRTIMCAIGLVVIILVLIPVIFDFISLMLEDTQVGGSFGPGFLIFIFCIFVFLLTVIALYGWMTWRMASTLLFARKPILLLNRESITVGRIPTFSGFFIPWAEVELLYAHTFMYKYLCIRPKDTSQFMKRFNPLERLLRYSNTPFGIPPLIVPQVYLERPVAEILHQAYYMYANELNYYHVRIQP